MALLGVTTLLTTISNRLGESNALRAAEFAASHPGVSPEVPDQLRSMVAGQLPSLNVGLGEFHPNPALLSADQWDFGGNSKTETWQGEATVSRIGTLTCADAFVEQRLARLPASGGRVGMDAGAGGRSWRRGLGGGTSGGT